MCVTLSIIKEHTFNDMHNKVNVIQFFPICNLMNFFTHRSEMLQVMKMICTKKTKWICFSMSVHFISI